MRKDREVRSNVVRNIPGMRHRRRFAEVERAENSGETLKRIWKYFAQEKGMLMGILAIVILGALSGIYAPSQQKNAIDIIAGSLEGDLARTLILMMVAYIFYCLCRLFQDLLSARLSQRIVKRMREELFGKLVDLPISYLDSHSHGDVMSRMTNDIENISITVSQSLPTLLLGVLTIFGTAAMMLWYCWQLALLSFTTVILTFLATRIISIQVRKFSRERQALLGQLNGIVEEMISGYRTVVAYNRQEATIKEFCETSDALTQAGIRTDVFGGVMGPIMNCIGNIRFVIIAAFGGYFALKGLISVGVVSAFLVYARQFSRPINHLSHIYGQLQTAIAGAERVFQVLDEKNEDMAGDELKGEGPAEVEFKKVDFSYVKGRPVLQNFNLKVPAGKKVALVGATGSGKTTVANLLLRFYDVDRGEIRVGGQDIAEVSRTSLRRNIAIVLQDTVLFSDTVRNNLKYANEGATEEQIKKAVKMSRCEELISLLPDGYDTVLVGSGANISQGQRQLLAIARAFVADPKILILDEATSNVDTRTEKAIQDAMQLIMQNRTSIVIAHRLSTIRDADIIIVMDEGKIVEQGNHEELLAKRGKYYDLYMMQFAGFAT